MKKILALFLSLGLIRSIDAQDLPFVRVYDAGGRKFMKGQVSAVTDSTLVLKLPSAKVEVVPRSKISMIKTRRSAARNIVGGAVLGAGTGAAIGAMAAEESANQPDLFNITADTELMTGGGAIVGFFTGAAIGSITSLLTKRRTFVLDDNPKKWEEFSAFIANRISPRK